MTEENNDSLPLSGLPDKKDISGTWTTSARKRVKEKRLTVDMPSQLHREFKAYCVQKGTTMNDWIVAAIKHEFVSARAKRINGMDIEELIKISNGVYNERGELHSPDAQGTT